MRICGMVRNEGEPGGGPYFVKNQNDETSLQIVEYSQMNHADEKQEEILKMLHISILLTLFARHRTTKATVST